MLALLQKLWKITSLKLKLLFFLLYLLSFMYIFTRFASSLLKPYVVETACKCSYYTSSIVSVSVVVICSVVCVLGFVSEIRVVGVLLSLLVVLFLRMYSIRPKLNLPPTTMCLLILEIVHLVGSFS